MKNIFLFIMFFLLGCNSETMSNYNSELTQKKTERSENYNETDPKQYYEERYDDKGILLDSPPHITHVN